MGNFWTQREGGERSSVYLLTESQLKTFGISIENSFNVTKLQLDNFSIHLKLSFFLYLFVLELYSTSYMLFLASLNLSDLNLSSVASTLSSSASPPSSVPPLHLRCGHTRRRWAAGWWAETAAVPQDSDLDPAHLPSRCRWRPHGDFPPGSPLNQDFLRRGEENRKRERGGRNRTKSEIKEEIVGEDKGVKIRFYISPEIHCHLSYHLILLVTFSFCPQTPLGEGKGFF